MPKFRIQYEVDDGYVGGMRPHSFEIDAADFDGMTADQVWALLQDQAYEAMQEIAQPSILNFKEAMRFIKEHKAETE